MKTVQQQVSECIKLYTKGFSIRTIDSGDVKYLSLGYNNVVYSSLIIDNLTFEVADLLESKVNPTEESMETKANLKMIIENFLEGATEITKEKFNKYSFDGNITFVEGSKYGISTQVLISIYKLLKDFTEIKLFIKDGVICFTDSHDNILLLKGMQTLQESLF